MSRAIVPYDPGWVCRKCRGPKLAGDPWCQGCAPEDKTRGGTKRPERIKIQKVPTTGALTTEGKEQMAKGKKEDKEFSKHVALQVGRTVLSLERTRGILAAIQPWGRPELVTGADAVVKAVQVLIAAFDELPDGWAPPRGTAHAGAGPSLGKGDFVRIADKRREEYAKKYAGMITAKDMDHLEVLTIAETGRLVVKTKGGALLPGIPRGHLHREEAKARIVEPAS